MIPLWNIFHFKECFWKFDPAWNQEYQTNKSQRPAIVVPDTMKIFRRQLKCKQNFFSCLWTVWRGSSQRICACLDRGVCWSAEYFFSAASFAKNLGNFMKQNFGEDGRDFERNSVPTKHFEQNKPVRCFQNAVLCLWGFVWNFYLLFAQKRNCQ